MKKKVLIVTNTLDDGHADALISRALERGFTNFIRLNTDSFLSNANVHFDGTNIVIRFKDSKFELSSKDITSVWFRRPVDLHPPVEVLDKDAKDFCQKQGTAFLRGFYFSIHDDCRWVNPLPSLHQARHKISQLCLARKIGFKIPATIVSNEPENILSFSKQYRHVCVKSLDAPNFRNGGKLHAWLTRPVTFKEIKDNYEEITLCPVFFQELLSKKSDIRVTVIGEKIFSVEIDSQTQERSRNDFRGLSPENLKHSVHQLPEDIQKKIISFMRNQGLVFSAFDFVRTLDDRYVFIENNPNGQWLWLEYLTGLALRDEMIDYLNNTHQKI